MATRVVLEVNGDIVEDTCLLQLESIAWHINFAKLYAVLKYVNLTLQWKVTVFHLVTDSTCIQHWPTDTLTGKTRMNTKVVCEMLETLYGLMKEYVLVMNGKLV